MARRHEPREPSRAPSRPRGPGLTFLAAAAVVVVVVAAVARATHQAPPPTIAEFAPQAVKQITEPPPNQTSQVGEESDETDRDEADASGADGADGGEGAGGTNGEADPADDTGTRPGEDPDVDSDADEETPRLKRCVAGPDGVLRQTEDPQSPPCVDFWDSAAGNGGATAKGVDADEIRIAVPKLSGENAHDVQVARDFEAYFNLRYQFYGRRLRLIPTAGDFAGSEDFVQTERKAAANADQLHRAFASTDTTYNGGANYRAELANRGIISAAEEPYVSETKLSSTEPYSWSYPMDSDRMLRSLGEWLCARVGPGPAQYTTDPRLSALDRKVGLIAQEIGGVNWREPVDRFLKPELAECGIDIERPYYTPQFGTGPTAWSTLMSDYGPLGEQVTTVICLCFATDIATSIAPAATNQGYFPEWVVTNYFAMLNANVVKLMPKEQSRHMFGISVMPRDVAFANDPAIWALTEVNPEFYRPSGAYDPNATAFRRYIYDATYQTLLLLASGIQMAGSHLTPETFDEALHGTRFPNPDHPNRPGKVRFQGGAHSMEMDAVEWWWSNEARSPYNDTGPQTGAWCYTEGGERYPLGGWPNRPSAVFAQPCDSGA